MIFVFEDFGGVEVHIFSETQRLPVEKYKYCASRLLVAVYHDDVACVVVEVLIVLDWQQELCDAQILLEHTNF